MAKVLTETVAGIIPFPAGMVMAFAGSTPPPGWLHCDGSLLSRTTYAPLFAAIGTSWGSGDGSTTFHLPDLRGRFLRGVDGAAGRDPNSGTRTASNAGGNTGNAVGSVQANATAVNGLSNASSAVTGTAAAQAWTYGAASGTAAAQAWTYGAASGTAAAQVWTYGAASGTAAGQTLGTTAIALASGSAAGQTLATTNISIASGVAAGQTQGPTNVALSGGSAAGQTLSVAAVALASGLAAGQTLGVTQSVAEAAHTHGAGSYATSITGTFASATHTHGSSDQAAGLFHFTNNTPPNNPLTAFFIPQERGITTAVPYAHRLITDLGNSIVKDGTSRLSNQNAGIGIYGRSDADNASTAIGGSNNVANTSGAGSSHSHDIAHTHGTSVVTGTTSINHTHGASVVTGTTDISHTHASSLVTGTTNIGHTHAASAVTGTTDIGHTHASSSVTGVTGTNATSSVTGVTGTNAASSVTGVTGTNATSAVTGTAAAQALSGDAETRPLNANVNYIIKT